MTGSSQHRRVQLLGLLAERAVFGLGPAQQRQVGRLLEDSGDIDAECMDRLAASLALAGVGQAYRNRCQANYERPSGGEHWKKLKKALTKLD